MLVRFSRLFFIIPLCGLCFPWQSIWAWGLTGHRIVGGIAQKHMSPNTSSQLSHVLSGYQLQDVGNWADEIKSDQSVFSRSLRKWHYIDLSSETYFDQPIDFDHWPGDLYQALEYVIARLTNRAFDQELTEEVLIRLLVHLVADAHQPLHVGNGIDSGGNTCYVRWFGSKWTMSLHSVWDNKLIDVYKLSYSEYVDYLNHANAQQVVKWQRSSVKDWLLESYRLHSLVYPSEKGLVPGDYCVKNRSLLQQSKIPSLGFAYQYKVRPILNQRLLQAGIRLAGVLNQIYDVAE